MLLPAFDRFLLVGCSCSQPVVMCRQCPGYRKEVGQLLFAAASNFWPGLQPPPPPPPPPPPAKARAAEEVGEGSAPAAVDQPSTSSESPSGEDHHAPTFPPLGAPQFSNQPTFTFPFFLVVGSSSGVPLPPSGLPSHLHLLPPADA